MYLQRLPILVLILLASPLLAAQNRLALVIGNADYRHTNPLLNTLNDAHDLAEDLRGTGFQVQEVVNADLDRLIDAIDRFVSRLHEQGGVGLLYYSGHGVQVDGQNYLVPVGARLKRKSRIKYEAYALNDALGRMGGRGAGSINLVILDACRDNPFASTRGGAGKGLARIDAPESTLILYAAKPGQTASDNPEGRNGLFTKYLRQAIRKPGRNVENTFADVVKNVYRESAHQQYPWKEGVLLHPFSFVQGQESSSEPAISTQSPTGLDPELLFWQSIKDSSDPGVYSAYLNKYPKGVFAELARLKLGQVATATPEAPKNLAVSYRRSLIKRVVASSVLRSQKDVKGRRYRYGPENAMDGKHSTAWVEGANKHGIGEWLKVVFRQKARIHTIGIDGEYKGKKNNRLKRVRITFSNGGSATMRLRDATGSQSFELTRPVETDWVKVGIEAVYPGTRFADTPISEISFQ